MNITDVWTGLTEPQASLIASAATVLSALIVAILGPLIFRGAVKGIEDARDKATEAADSIKQKFDELSEQLSSLTVSLANVQNRVEEVVVAEQSSAQPGGANDPGEARRERLRQEWSNLQRQAESLAAASWIDGRTQGKYSRIDRRSYIDVLKALEQDHHLAGQMQDWERALNLWYTFRARNTPPPSEADLNEMLNLRIRLDAAIEAFRQVRESAAKQARDIRRATKSRRRPQEERMADAGG